MLFKLCQFILWVLPAIYHEKECVWSILPATDEMTASMAFRARAGMGLMSAPGLARFGNGMGVAPARVTFIGGRERGKMLRPSGGGGGGRGGRNQTNQARRRRSGGCRRPWPLLSLAIASLSFCPSKALALMHVRAGWAWGLQVLLQPQGVLLAHPGLVRNRAIYLAGGSRSSSVIGRWPHFAYLLYVVTELVSLLTEGGERETGRAAPPLALRKNC